MPEQRRDWRPSLSFEKLRKDISSALSSASRGGIDDSTVDVARVVREVHAHLTELGDPLTLFERAPESVNSVSVLDNAGKNVVSLRVITTNGDYEEVKVNLASDFIATAKALSEELVLDPIDAASLLYTSRTYAARRADRDVTSACRELFKSERRDQLLALEEILRTPLTEEPEGGSAIRNALLRERDLLLLSGLLEKLLNKLSEGFNAGSYRSKSSPKGLVEGEAVMLAETVFLITYTVQCSMEEALAVRSAAAAVAGKLATARDDSAQTSQQNTSGPRQAELTVVSHLLFLSWSCALDRSRYRDLFNPRTSSFGVNELLRNQGFLAESRKEQPVQLAPHDLVGCLFRLAVETPDEEADAVNTPLRVCVGERKALQYLSEELPEWLSTGSAILSPDADLYKDAFEDLTIDLAEAPTLCSVLIDFTQETASAAASYSMTDGERGQSGTVPQPPDGSNLVASLAKMFSRTVGLSKEKLGSSRSVYGGLRYLCGPHSSGGAIQRLGDSVIDLGDTAMRDPDAPGGVGKFFSTALVEFLSFLSACADVSIPYAASVARYLAESGHPMASIERLQAAVTYYTRALRGTDGGELNPAESQVFEGLVTAVGSCARTLRSNGDFLSLFGNDFPIRLASLAILELRPSLKGALVDALRNFGDAAGIMAFLESVAVDRCAGLAKEINSIEAASGIYTVTISVMRLVKFVLDDQRGFADESNDGSREDAMLPPAIESLIQFALEHVLSHWGRRQYKTEVERWTVASAVVDLVYSARGSLKMVTRMLLPAPGSGGPCASLKALAAIAGLRQGANLEGIPAGAQALTKMVTSGNGTCVKLMETAVVRACGLLNHLLDIPTVELRRASVTAVSAGELLLSESTSAVAAASIMGAGSSASAVAANYIASLITRAPALSSKIVDDRSARELRASIASSVGKREEDEEVDEEEEEARPLFDSILTLVSACLSHGKSIEAGLFFLGISKGTQAVVSEYGVLAGLCERIRSAPRLDDKRVATSAAFLAFLAGNSTVQTSYATLDFLRNNESGSCATEALVRIYMEVQLEGIEGVDFRHLARVLLSCMRIAALESRVYSAENLAADKLPDGGSLLLGLLRIVARVAREEELQNLAVMAASSWRQLFWTSASRFQQEGRLNTATLYEIAAELLEGLGGSADTDMERLFQADGALIASSTALLCISLLREPTTDSAEVDLTQAASILERIVHAISGKLGSRPDGSNARTALYSCLVHAEELVESFSRNEAFGNAGRIKLVEGRSSLRGAIDSIYARVMGETRIGRRQWSGAEGIIAIASADALSGYAAARSAAIHAISCVIRMDTLGASTTGGSLTALNALSAQNRLRKLSSAALAEPATVDRIAQLFSNLSTVQDEADAEKAASLFVAESALILLQEVANAPGGGRSLTDAGVVENAAYLAAALSSGSNSDLRIGGKQAYRTEPISMEHDEGFDEYQSTQDTRAALGGALAAVASASLRRRGGSRPDSAIASPAIAVIESGQTMFAELIRGLQDASVTQLEAANAVGLLLSRLPSELVVVGAASMLVHLSARFSLSLFRSKQERMWSGAKPNSAREARRSQVTHPEGGSLFERDVAVARMSCARSLLAAVRGSPVLLTMFAPNLSSSRDPSMVPTKTSLGDLIRVAKIVLMEMNYAVEEELRITANLTGVSRRLPSLKDFCMEEFGLSGSSLTGHVLEKCMLKTAEKSRTYAERICSMVLESLLYILREYTRSARETHRGTLKSLPMSLSDADSILTEGRTSLLSLCRDIEAVENRKDSTFMRQLSRQIRTHITEK